MNRLWPAEPRLKEGAEHVLQVETGGSIPLPRTGGALVAHCGQSSRSSALLSIEPAGIASHLSLSPRRSPVLTLSRHHQRQTTRSDSNEGDGTMPNMTTTAATTDRKSTRLNSSH